MHSGDILKKKKMFKIFSSESVSLKFICGVWAVHNIEDSQLQQN